jgi:16S rRNA (cytidine1402-2'-O)-methyltransferase
MNESDPPTSNLSAHADFALSMQKIPGLGRLFLVPSTLDFGCEEQVPLQQVLPQHTIQIASKLGFWVCENAKSLRAYLKRVGLVFPLTQSIQQIQIQELPRLAHKKGDHLQSTAGAQSMDAAVFLNPALQGHDMGLASEAGMPGVADPGSSLVRAAHTLNIDVIPLVGPSSLLMALSGFGLNGQSFAFVGYLPSEGLALQKRLRELEALLLKTYQTQIFIETPYRNNSLFKAMLSTLGPKIRIGLSSALTMSVATTQCKSVESWRDWLNKTKQELPKDLPIVFAIGV